MLLRHLRLAAAEVQRRAAGHAARAAAEQAAVHAAAAQAAHAELVSMHSMAQSKATDLNEAEIAHFMMEVRSWAACIAHTHAHRRVLLSLKHQLWYGALECACSHATVHDSTADMSSEDACAVGLGSSVRGRALPAGLP